MTSRFFVVAFLSSASAMAAAPLAAERIETPVQPSEAVTFGDNGLAQFTPAAERRDHRVDYSYLDEALGWFVIPMGPSLRDGAPLVDPRTGTRRIFGHTSRFRLEGNRVAFDFFTPEIRAALTEYRQDLEEVGSRLDLARMPRNEQLAFWLNLHNVAVIEALAQEYPLSSPSRGRFGSNQASLQDAKLVTVKGVALSPRDIREKIVYPNWRDAKVIYGFWRGEIGGPSIQRLAYTGDNVDALLRLSAEEFVNSLRGVERFAGSLRVSRIYEEAAPFYFNDFDALRAHMTGFAREEVRELFTETPRTSYADYEGDIADLVGGRRDTGVQEVCSSANGDLGEIGGAFEVGNCVPQNNVGGRNLAALRLIQERNDKLAKAAKRGIRTGTVTVGEGEVETGREVE